MEFPEIAKYGAALLAAIALILALYWVLRRFFNNNGHTRHSTKRRRTRRLGVEESAQVSPRHRLLLVRRDDREHLLLIGGTNDLVIETGILHASSQDAVNTHNVEPRLEADDFRSKLSTYRPGNNAGLRTPSAKGPLTPPTFRPEFDDGDSGHTAGSNLSSPLSNFDDAEPKYESGSSMFNRNSLSKTKTDNDSGKDIDGDQGSKPDEKESTESQILSRFLKKDST